MKKFRNLTILILIVGLALFIAACSNNTNEGQETPQTPQTPSTPSPAVPEKAPEPVTLKLFFVTPPNEETYQTRFVEPTKSKYPHITLERIDATAEMRLAQYVAAGQVPDIVFDGLTNILPILQLDIPLALDDLVKKHNVDIGSIDPQIMKEIRSYTEKGELIFWPFNQLVWALHYNKEIFDKFGVPYPQDGNTWEDLYALAARVSRTQDGIVYRGLGASTNLNRLQTQLSLPYVNPQNDAPMINNYEGWRKLFQTYKTIVDIPGNYPAGSTYTDGNNHFWRDQIMAMHPQILRIPNVETEKFAALTTFPVFKDIPGKGPAGFMDGFIISKASPNIEAAFQFAALFTSKERQMAQSKMGSATVLNDNEVRRVFNEENPHAQGIDFTKFFTVGPADSYRKTQFDQIGRTAAIKYLREHIDGKSDLNTALRSAEEETIRNIAAEKAK